MTNEQWECIYNAAYAASDAWKKERNDLQYAKEGLEKELKYYREDRDYWKGFSEQNEVRITALENELDGLAAANQKLADQRDQDVGALGDATQERDEWKARAEHYQEKVKALEQGTDVDELAAANQKLTDERDYWKSNSEHYRDKFKALEKGLDELIEANQHLVSERDEAQSERDEAIKERACLDMELRATISGYNGLTILYDKLVKQHEELKEAQANLIASGEELRASHETYKQSREYWKNLYDQERAHSYNLETENLSLKRAVEALEGQADKADVDPYKRLDALERIVGVHEVNIYNLDTRVDKLEEAK